MNGKGTKKMLDFVEEISFEEIKEVWEKELWPNKKNGVAKANEWTCSGWTADPNASPE